MRISTSGRYALRAMLDLALYAQEGPVLRQEIADRQEISAEYIAQLFRSLCRDGLAHSTMGPGGGYTLGRKAVQIRVGDVIRSVEGPIAVVACVGPNGQAVCDRIESCTTHLVWKRLSLMIEEYLDSITLHDLSKIAKELYANGSIACPADLDKMLKIIDTISPAQESCPRVEDNHSQTSEETA